MLVPNLDQKAVPHDEPRLLPDLIAPPRRGLVEDRSLLRASKGWSPGLAFRERTLAADDPRPTGSLPQRVGLLALRSIESERVLPGPLESEPAHPKDAYFGT